MRPPKKYRRTWKFILRNRDEIRKLMKERMETPKRTEEQLTARLRELTKDFVENRMTKEEEVEWDQIMDELDEIDKAKLRELGVTLNEQPDWAKPCVQLINSVRED